uniref:G-protein coupled receptors family 1 profile domain-containing protein n=1 Tax=Panagrolaimus sp. PS1159 TaxID=55785 RepID=A0AC35FAY2_9BILA
MSAPIGERPILINDFENVEYSFASESVKGMSATASNITLNTYIYVPDSYMSDVIWNLAGVLPSWIPNIFVLIIGCFGSIKGRFKHSIIGMTASQFYATVFQSILYFGYLYLNQAKIPITVLACSIPRRLLQQTITPALMSILVISIDRYLSIICGYTLTKAKLFILFLIPFIYAHFVYNSLTIFPFEIGTSDMCGPCLSMPKKYSKFLEPITPVTLIIAILLNIRILIFLHHYHTNKRALNTFSPKELKDTKKAMMGVTLQACIPMLFSMPQVINLAMYNIDSAIRMPKSFWVVINFLNYFSLCLNPLVTMLYVKQFRIATVKFLKNGKLVTGNSVHEFTAVAAATQNTNIRRSIITITPTISICQ